MVQAVIRPKYHKTQTIYLLFTNYQTKWLKRSVDNGKIFEYQRPTYTDNIRTRTGFNDSRSTRFRF